MSKKPGGRTGKTNKPPAQRTDVDQSVSDVNVLKDRKVLPEVEGLASRLRAVCDSIGRDRVLRATGLAKKSLQRYLSGDQIPGSDVLIALAVGTECDPVWLLTGEGTGPFPVVEAGSRKGRKLVAGTRKQLLAVMDHLGLALESLRPLLTDPEREEIESSLERLAPRFRGDAPND